MQPSPTRSRCQPGLLVTSRNRSCCCMPATSKPTTSESCSTFYASEDTASSRWKTRSGIKRTACPTPTSAKAAPARSIRSEADHIGELLDVLRKRGYRFIALEDALGDQAYSLPDTYVGEGGTGWIDPWAITQGKIPDRKSTR